MTTTFVGKEQTLAYAAIVIAHGLELYAATGIKPNRAYTPANMMKMAMKITGRRFKARDYRGAALALKEYVHGTYR